MNRILSGSALFVALGLSSAFASPLCTDSVTIGGSTLDKYIALGSSGCEMNGLVFNNFAYGYSLGVDSSYTSGQAGTGQVQTASMVSVLVSAPNTSVQFSASWVVNRYQTANLSLTFDVSAPSSLVTSLTSGFTGGQSGSTTTPPVTTKSAVCSGGSCAPTDFTNVTTAVSGSGGPIHIANTLDMNANYNPADSSSIVNNVHYSNILDQFSAITVSTPEPATYAMFGGALALLGFLRRRK